MFAPTSVQKTMANTERRRNSRSELDKKKTYFLLLWCLSPRCARHDGQEEPEFDQEDSEIEMTGTYFSAYFTCLASVGGHTQPTKTQLEKL